jgi:hypothetical protein
MGIGLTLNLTRKHWFQIDAAAVKAHHMSSSLLMTLTLAITWPQEVVNKEENLAAAAQVHGDVR